MKIPSHYSLVKEHPQSYEVHDSRDDSRFHVAKAGLDLGMHGNLSKIKAYSDGGKVTDEHIKTQGNQDARNKIAASFGGTPQKLADGGIAGVSERTELADAAASSPQYAPPPTPVESTPFVPVMPAPTAGGVSAVSGTGAYVPPDAPNSTPETAAPSSQIPGEGVKPADSNPMSSFAKSKDKGLEGLEKDLNESRKTETSANAGMAKAWSDHSTALAAMKTPEAIIAEGKKADDLARSEYEKQTIDPNRVWHNMNTGSKIAASLGMILGGIGAATGGGENQGIKAINEAIDRDIDAQKGDQSKKMNLWKMNREATQNELSANLNTRNQMLNAVEAKVHMFAAQMGGAETQLKFAPLLMDIQRQKDENHLRLGLLHGSMSEMDPSQVMTAIVKNPEQQKLVSKEIADAKYVKQNLGTMMTNYDQMAKDKRLMTGGNPFYAAGVIPPSEKIVMSGIDPIVRDEAGRPNEFTQKGLTDLLPNRFDSDATIKLKRAQFQEKVMGKTNGELSKSLGIDLSKFKSTSYEGGVPAEQRQTMNSVEYVKVPGGWKRAQ